MEVLDFLVYWSYPYISSYILIPNPIQGQNQKFWLCRGHCNFFFFFGRWVGSFPIILGLFPNFLGDQCNNNNNTSGGFSYFWGCHGQWPPPAPLVPPLSYPFTPHISLTVNNLNQITQACYCFFIIQNSVSYNSAGT